ncbi:unnamed protein product [Symbiodinium microadriaticum]|nr:unnamed protein product [Symbiodinium microadriaticum]CAE7267113.1 unnamed protein product [Symbiodinium sp. KB8]
MTGEYSGDIETRSSWFLPAFGVSGGDLNTPPESVSELADDVAFALLGSVLVLELLELELLSAFVALRLVFCFAFGFGTLLGFAVLLLWDTPPDPAAPELRVARAARTMLGDDLASKKNVVLVEDHLGMEVPGRCLVKTVGTRSPPETLASR